jgi:hypothetical protein
MEWTSIERTTFRNGMLVITNTNKLVGRLSGVDGLKTATPAKPVSTSWPRPRTATGA